MLRDKNLFQWLLDVLIAVLIIFMSGNGANLRRSALITTSTSFAKEGVPMLNVAVRIVPAVAVIRVASASRLIEGCRIRQDGPVYKLSDASI
jgi:hypothetical protein